MHAYTAVIEHCPDTQLYVGYVPGFAGAHSQGGTVDELTQNLREVIEMLLEDGPPATEEPGSPRSPKKVARPTVS